ncbi:MAG: type II secretion system major pseudopilin GspG [Deltaproteobacteria bacterium]
MKSQGGFTLIEIMVVLVIIAGLVYIVSTNVIGRLGQARVEQTKIQIKQLESALGLFKVDNGFYPETQQGLESLIAPPGVGRAIRKYPPDGYLSDKRLPQDAWGGAFVYIGPDQTQDGSFEIISSGEDGVPQNDDDITSRNIE